MAFQPKPLISVAAVKTAKAEAKGAEDVIKNILIAKNAKIFTWTNVQVWSSLFHRLRGPERGWGEIIGPLKCLYMIINLILINCNSSSQKRNKRGVIK